MTEKKKTRLGEISQEGFQPSKPKPGFAQDGYAPKATGESKQVSPPPKKP